LNIFASGGLGIASQNGVSTAPGDSAATRTPRWKTSTVVAVSRTSSFSPTSWWGTE
jgi:cobalamin biosynthesis protein CbiD